MHEHRDQLVEEIRIAERARDLLAGLERRLKERDRSDLEEHLGHLERLAGSLPEAHTVRLLAEEAVRSARDRGGAMPVPPRAGPARRLRGDSLRSGALLAATTRSPAWTRSAPPNEGALPE